MTKNKTVMVQPEKNKLGNQPMAKNQSVFTNNDKANMLNALGAISEVNSSKPTINQGHGARKQSLLDGASVFSTHSTIFDQLKAQQMPRFSKGGKTPKPSSIQLPIVLNVSKIANGLYDSNFEALLKSDIHPVVKSTGIKLISGDQIMSTNQITVAILLAIYEVVKDF